MVSGNLEFKILMTFIIIVLIFCALFMDRK